MRASSILAVLFLSAAASCIPNNTLGTESAAHINVYRLQEICLGMTEEEVFRIMRYPAVDEQIVFEDLCYDVWFYVTRMTVLGQSELLPRNLTPLIFKDGILVAKGYDYYHHLLDQKEGYERHPSKKRSDIENKGLERALDAPTPQKEIAPPVKPPQTPKNGKPQVSMSSKPTPSKKPEKPVPEKPDEEEEREQEGYSWDEQDERIQEQQQEQNFDYW